MLEYFISTRTVPARVSPIPHCVPRIPVTSHRRLVDVSQDVIVRYENCGFRDGIYLPVFGDDGAVNDNIVGRFPPRGDR